MIPIIYYHSIAQKKNKKWFRNFLTLETVYFESHLKLLKELGYQTINLDEYLDMAISESITNKKLVVLTFDDGYLDNYVFAYPLLKKYGFTGTIFVNSDYIDRRTTRRQNLEDYWSGKVAENELKDLGFLNPEEMRFLESSGVMKIESHTKTHDMYNVSDRITGFHRPGSECLYPIVNIYPELKPYYAGDPEFEKMIPYGTPFFEERSAVIAKRTQINPDLIMEIVKIFTNHDWSNPYNFEQLYSKVAKIHRSYQQTNSSIVSIEADSDFESRVIIEIMESKVVLERELEREVRFLCWPHGDNNEFGNRIAEEMGFKATTLGKGEVYDQKLLRLVRFGLGSVRDSVFLTKLKSRYKIGEVSKKFPYSTISKIYHGFRGVS